MRLSRSIILSGVMVGLLAYIISPALYVQADPTYTMISSASKVVTMSGTHAKLGVITACSTASCKIPRSPDTFIAGVIAFGYAFYDSSTGDGVIAVIHGTLAPDSNQNPNGWHVHKVSLDSTGGYGDTCASVSSAPVQGGGQYYHEW